MKNILFLLADDLALRALQPNAARAAPPTLDALARRGTSFAQMIASATMTTQCVASLLTGCYPFVNGVRLLRGDVLQPSVPTLAEILHAQGYRTIALVTGPLWEGAGIERGFEQYDYRKPSPPLAETRRDQIRALIAPGSDPRPWFIYAHFYDIHAPRVVTPEFDQPAFGRTLYDRAVATLDHRFGEILANVNWDDTLVVVHADHGEVYPETPWLERREKIWQDCILGKKSPLRRLGVKRDPTVTLWTKLKRLTRMGHGFNLSEDLVRVPFILAGAHAVPAGQVVAEQARQVDIMPTLLELAGITPPPGLSGKSLLPLMLGAETETRPACMETLGFGRDPNFFMRGLRLPPWKYIDSPTDPRVQPQLYALDRDPHEKRNVIRRYPDVAAQMKQRLDRETTAAVQAREAEAWSSAEAAQIEERLRNLGYY